MQEATKNNHLKTFFTIAVSLAFAALFMWLALRGLQFGKPITSGFWYRWSLGFLHTGSGLCGGICFWNRWGTGLPIPIRSGQLLSGIS